MSFSLPERLTRLSLPQDIPALSPVEKEALAADVREAVIQVVSRNGGHLAPSLGVVELTLALLSCFNPAVDKVVWDVGHQTYPWKLLTGRAAQFPSLRLQGGLSGFPKRSESECDAFGTGHASTSISAALGMAYARELKGGMEHVVAVIGDGSMTGGMAFEALNHAGSLDKRLIVILNDNDMSISRSVGALSLFLSRNLSNSGAMFIKEGVGQLLRKIPGVGETIVETIRRGETSFKTFFTSGMLFEALGFNYIGPVDGHDLNRLIDHLNAVKELNYPVLLHVKTVKGKGYAPAERNPSKFHGIGAFEPDTGICPPPTPSDDPVGPGFSAVFGQTMLELARSDETVIAITAAMPDGTGLTPFAGEFPDRFVDVGICEEHALTFAAGLAARGFKPVVAIYSTFMQRAYDQLIHDVCLQNLPVVLCLDRAGIVGEDGPTHHGAFDLSWLRAVPNLSILAPRDEKELRDALYTAIKLNAPVAIRYPRGRSRTLGCFTDNRNGANVKPVFLKPGSGEVLSEGDALCVLNAGHHAAECLEAADLVFQKTGQRVTVFNARWIKPLPEEQLTALAVGHQMMLAVEENTLMGGFSSAVLEYLADHDLLRTIRFARIGLPDRFVSQGAACDLRAEIGLDAEGIARKIIQLLNESAKS